MKFQGSDDVHAVGDAGCRAGFCDGVIFYPYACEPDYRKRGCEGSVHANLLEQSANGSHVTSVKCDGCGREDQEVWV